MRASFPRASQHAPTNALITNQFGRCQWSSTSFHTSVGWRCAVDPALPRFASSGYAVGRVLAHSPCVFVSLDDCRAWRCIHPATVVRGGSFIPRFDRYIFAIAAWVALVVCVRRGSSFSKRFIHDQSTSSSIPLSSSRARLARRARVGQAGLPCL